METLGSSSSSLGTTRVLSSRFPVAKLINLTAITRAKLETREGEARASVNAQMFDPHPISCPKSRSFPGSAPIHSSVTMVTASTSKIDSIRMMATVSSNALSIEWSASQQESPNMLLLFKRRPQTHWHRNWILTPVLADKDRLFLAHPRSQYRSF